MRVVTKAQLLKMPSGTVYSSYEPHVFGPLSVFDGACGASDFFMANLTDDFGDDSTTMHETIAALERGEDVPLVFGECYGREGMFQESQLYAVWSAADLRGLSAFLAKCAEVAK